MNLRINDKIWHITFDKQEVPATRSTSEIGAWNLFRIQRSALSELSIKELNKQSYYARKDKKSDKT